jgi:hypothetical protein
VTVRDSTTGQTLAASTATPIHAELPVDCLNTEAVRDCLAQRANPNPAARGGAANPGAAREL